MSFWWVGALGVACGNVTELETTPQVETQQQEIREHQGREHQGREHQGSDFGGQNIIWLTNSLRKQFQGEPYTSAHDIVVVQEGQLVMRRSVPVGATASLNLCPSSTSGRYRSCGFETANVGQCTPGATLTLGGGGSCGGSCTGDAIIRVCAGHAPCEASAAIGSGDDECGSWCPRATFVCPSSGRFAVMSGAYHSVATASVNLVASSGTYPVLNVTHSGAELAGATLSAWAYDGTWINGSIAAVYGQDPYSYLPPGHVPGVTLRYDMRFVDNGNTRRLCDGAAADFDGVTTGLIANGYWWRDGEHYDDPSWFTASCSGGVVAKCIRWGYRPWDNFWSAQTYVLGEAGHQACTRMARGDYCGDGRSWTMNSTEINLYDLHSPQIQASDPAVYWLDDPMSFEAAWNRRGATCLSHKRWENAPEYVKDPFKCRAPYDRINIAPELATRRYCDSPDASVPFNPPGDPALLFNDSSIHDGGWFEGG